MATSPGFRRSPDAFAEHLGGQLIEEGNIDKGDAFLALARKVLPLCDLWGGPADPLARRHPIHRDPSDAAIPAFASLGRPSPMSVATSFRARQPKRSRHDRSHGVDASIRLPVATPGFLCHLSTIARSCAASSVTT